MKYIVSLFHATSGRVGFGLQNWDTFQGGFRVALHRGKFNGVRWDQWWEPRVRGERRKTERRQTRDRRSEDGQVRMRSWGPQEIYQILRAEKRRSRPRPQTERRISTNEREFPRLSDLTRSARESGLLTNETCTLLTDFFYALCSGEEFNGWKKRFSPLLMFEEPGWSESDHREKFRDYAVACCLDVLRPGTLGWGTTYPNTRHMELVSRFAELFRAAPVGSRLKPIRDFFEGRSDLGKTIRTLEPGKLPYPMKALRLVSQHKNLKPKAFFEKLKDQLRQLGAPLSSKPNSYRKQIERLKQATKEFEDRLGNSPP